jgi:hypothetical protein
VAVLAAIWKIADTAKQLDRSNRARHRRSHLRRVGSLRVNRLESAAGVVADVQPVLLAQLQGVRMVIVGARYRRQMSMAIGDCFELSLCRLLPPASMYHLTLGTPSIAQVAGRLLTVPD